MKHCLVEGELEVRGPELGGVAAYMQVEKMFPPNRTLVRLGLVQSCC